MKKIFPPRWANRFLEWYCRPDILEEVQGDAYELFERQAEKSVLRAKITFIWNVFRFFRKKNIKRKKVSVNQPNIMFNNYLKIALRSFLRQKGFSFINVFGLTIGFCCFILIASFVSDELSYDRRGDYQNIYRVGLKFEQNGGIDDYPSVDMAVAHGMQTEYPEIIESARITGAFADYMKLGENSIKESLLVFADSNFLKMLSIPLIEGSTHTALTDPNSIVISKEMATKYFGDKPALGQMMSSHRNGLLKVTGVFDKIPANNHFHFDAFISMVSAKWAISGRQTWSNVGFYSYVRLNEHSNAAALQSKFPPLVKKYVVPEVREDSGLSDADAEKSVNSWQFYLMPVKDIHLLSHTKFEIEPNGDINTIYIFSALALFILLLACINFMNLSTARSARRAMEIGIRKVMGSVRRQIMNQFLIESLMLSFVSLVFAVILSILLLPWFNQITAKQFTVAIFSQPMALIALVLLTLITGLVAGSYPAFYLSSFQPVRVLKGGAGAGKRSALRSSLVVFQFTISTALIIATIVAYRQLHYMQDIKLGYDKEQLLVVDNAGLLQKNQIPFKQRLKTNSQIADASNSFLPVGTANSFGGSEVTAKENPTKNIHITIGSMDYDYVKMMGMEIVIGRNFGREFPSDSLDRNIIINETAMHDLGWNESNVIGGTIVRSAQAQHKVVGVIKDFHYTSVKDKIAPMMIFYRGYSPATIVRLNTDDIPSAVTAIKTQWEALDPELPFSYYFVDEKFDHLYKSEQTTETVFVTFMVVAILIACVGLYGLSAFSAEQQKKEIGIRKVLGSSIGQIVVQQSRGFVLLVLISVAIASPLAWWSMHQWLNNFSYRITPGVWVFLAAGGAAVAVAILTVSFQAVRAARTNPVDSLRSE